MMTTRSSKWKRQLRAYLSLPAYLASLPLARESGGVPNYGASTWERLLDQTLAPWIDFRLHRPYPPIHPYESVGQYGERLACEYLRRKRYFILEKSFRAPGGEIDIVAAWKSRVVVFIEVKTWLHESPNDGGPADRVDERKQKTITNTALRYLKQHHLFSTTSRLDVIEVILEPLAKPGPQFRHFENAFEAIGKYQLFS